MTDAEIIAGCAAARDADHDAEEARVERCYDEAYAATLPDVCLALDRLMDVDRAFRDVGLESPVSGIIRDLSDEWDIPKEVGTNGD
jgi:hypothetical protein